MNFLTDIYSKVLGTNSKKLVKGSLDGSGFTEDFDNEEGFVLYSATESKRYKAADSNSTVNNCISYESFQQSSTYSPAASTLHITTEAKVKETVFPRRDETFLTVSDLPMELSKLLQVMQQMNQQAAGAVMTRSPPNVEQYHYDFTLERNVLEGFERV
ncbi:uncharacterized protein [Montipora foliosa]|uniref:uncharacterized protein n=1 Tax=Montipora foliosa TaxID=591990 RepID=UPI0035F185B5